jgi:hypothetical protein
VAMEDAGTALDDHEARRSVGRTVVIVDHEDGPRGERVR